MVFLVFEILIMKTIKNDKIQENYENKSISISNELPVYQIIMNAKTSEECNSLELNDKKKCIDKVYLQNAINDMDLNQCSLVDKEIECKDNINLLLANKNNNFSFCKKIKSEKIKYNCIMQPNLFSQEACNLLNETNMKQCKNQLQITKAQEKSDKKRCESITSQEEKKYCKNIVLFEQIIKTNELSKCDTLTKEFSTKCKDIVNFQNGKSNKANCEKIRDIQLKEHCKKQ